MRKLQHPQVIIPTLDIIPIEQNDIKKYLGKIKLNKIKVAFFGSDSFVNPVLQALEQNFEITLVVTALGSVIQMEAEKLGISILTPTKLDENSLGVNTIPPPRWDLIVVASYGKIIPKSILNIPKFGALNVHPSLLPKYRGSSPVTETILNGDKATGVTIIKMDEKMDHGPIVVTKEVSLTGQEDFLFLINKLFQVGADLLVKIIPDYINGKIRPKPQKHAQATYTKRFTKQDGYFDINNPPSPEQLNRMIRAYYPWPGVWTRWSFDYAQDKKGKIVKFLPEGKIQMEGKKPLTLKDFLNGYPDFPAKSITLDKK